MYDFEQIRVDVCDGVAIVTLNRPEKLNPLGKVACSELRRAFEAMRCDPDVRAVVVTGAGRAFSAGGDMDDIGGGVLQNAVEARCSSKEFVLAIQQMEKPVVCAVNGVAVGAGASLVLACDVVYVSESARFSMIFAKIGFIPDAGGIWLLQRLVGPNKAKELVFSADMIGADEMLACGIAQKVVPSDKLLDEAVAFARRLAQGPGLALSTAKALVNQAAGLSFEQYLELEAFALPQIAQSNDVKEGVASFFEKRSPVFSGK